MRAKQETNLFLKFRDTNGKVTLTSVTHMFDYIICYNAIYAKLLRCNEKLKLCQHHKTS